MRCMGCVAAVIGAAAVPGCLRAQMVAIAPQAFMIDARTRTAAVTLMNQDDTPADVSFSTIYGYPVTDAAGTMSLRTIDASQAVLTDTTPSAASWIQAYPRRMQLAPHSRRTVRLIASPPATLRDGEYWARLVVSVTGGRVRMSTADTASVRIGLNVEVRSVLPVFYRKGALSTGVRIDHPRATVLGDSVVTRAGLTRSGNAAFVGTVTVSLVDTRGKTVRTRALPLGVYYTLDPRITLSTAGLPKGTYRVTFLAESARPDLDRRSIVPAASVHGETTVTLR